MSRKTKHICRMLMNKTRIRMTRNLPRTTLLYSRNLNRNSVLLIRIISVGVEMLKQLY